MTDDGIDMMENQVSYFMKSKDALRLEQKIGNVAPYFDRNYD